MKRPQSSTGKLLSLEQRSLEFVGGGGTGDPLCIISYFLEINNQKYSTDKIENTHFFPPHRDT